MVFEPRPEGDGALVRVDAAAVGIGELRARAETGGAGRIVFEALGDDRRRALARRWRAAIEVDGQRRAVGGRRPGGWILCSFLGARWIDWRSRCSVRPMLAGCGALWLRSSRVLRGRGRSVCTAASL